MAFAIAANDGWDSLDEDEAEEAKQRDGDEHARQEEERARSRLVSQRSPASNSLSSSRGGKAGSSIEPKASGKWHAQETVVCTSGLCVVALCPGLCSKADIEGRCILSHLRCGYLLLVDGWDDEGPGLGLPGARGSMQGEQPATSSRPRQDLGGSGSSQIKPTQAAKPTKLGIKPKLGAQKLGAQKGSNLSSNLDLSDFKEW